MLTLDQVKTHLKLVLADTSEDELLGLYQGAAEGTFRQLSKRRWPATGEPTDPATGAYVDEAVLNADEQAMALQWLLLAIGHWYENKQEVVTDTRVASIRVPMACDFLMGILRTPTL